MAKKKTAQQKKQTLKEKKEKKDDVKENGKATPKRVANPGTTSSVELMDLNRKIIDEAKKIATNEVSSCYTLMLITRELIEKEREFLAV
tara:strand:- start:24179 stop:24445 length:267 start_codon:yes stop_codon:yes gene_type:complete